MEQIYGHIERITYQDSTSGFTVASLHEEGKERLTTIVGVLSSIQPGETVRCSGAWKNNSNYGMQFEVKELQVEAPSTLYGVQKYLESGLIKGIGPAYAERIVKTFGLDTLDIIDSDPKKLLKVPGIGKKRLSIITKHWDAQKSIRTVMVFLQSYNISPAYAQKIYKKFGEKSIEKVKENPYCLAKEIRGIGFKSADAIAKSMNIPHDSRFRIEAGIEHILSECSDDGHVCYPLHKLIDSTAEQLEVEKETVHFQTSSLEKEGRIVIDHMLSSLEQKPFVWLKPLHIAESGIAYHISRLLKEPSTLRPVNSDKAVDWSEEKLGISFSHQQREALANTLVHKLQVITGGPGTGKSTIIAAIIAIFEVLGARIIQAAPTGRAAKRMAEITGRKASTIHSLLEFDFQIMGFKRNRENPIECDLLIIDETSMVDTALMYHMLKAIPNRARVLFVGDINQLPSVGPGNVLKDIIESRCCTVTMLNHIFRQAAGSRIITNAHRINNGSIPDLSTDPKSDFFFIYEEDPQKMAPKIISLVRDRLPRKFGFDSFSDIQVISPMRKGVIGIETLNDTLQEALNPSGNGIFRFGRKYRIGDKVMQIKNNYNKDIFNGDIGRITDLDSEAQELKVNYDDRVVAYDFTDLDELVHAYAVSVHKYQGSEAPCVIIPVHTCHYMMLNRNLLYTAVTRGRKIVIVIGTKKALSISVSNNNTKKRYSGLQQALQSRINIGAIA